MENLAPGTEAGAIDVVAAAIVVDGRLLVVSKHAAPDVFYLPGGKPDLGETPEQTLQRELCEELGIRATTPRLLGHIQDIAALERVPMRMTVFAADLDGDPRPAAEVAALGWTDGLDDLRHQLAPAVIHQVIPLLQSLGTLPTPA